MLPANINTQLAMILMITLARYWYVNHRRRKEVLFGGGGGKVLLFACEARAKNLGHAHLIEVQRALVALEGATAVWS